MRVNPSKPMLRWTSSAINLIFHGNSLVFGTGSSGLASRFPDQMVALMQPLLGSGIVPLNVGIGGQRILINSGGFNSMILTAPNNVDANMSPTKMNILVIFEGTNEMTANGADGEKSYQAYRTYCLTRKAFAAAYPVAPGQQGIPLKIMIMTTNPYGGAANTDASWNTQNQAVQLQNSLIRLHYREFADVLCDVANFGPFGAINAAAAANGGVYTRAMLQSSPVYVRSDGVAADYTHYGDYGYNQVAQCASLSLQTIDGFVPSRTIL